MRNPKVIASMNGGHFLTVNCSACVISLKAAAGIDLNQSGSPDTAGIGRGRMVSSSGGQRNVMAGDPASADTDSVDTSSGSVASFVIVAFASAGPPPGADQEAAGLRNLAAALRRIQNRPRLADTRALTALP